MSKEEFINKFTEGWYKLAPFSAIEFKEDGNLIVIKINFFVHGIQKKIVDVLDMVDLIKDRETYLYILKAMASDYYSELISNKIEGEKNNE